MSRLRLYNLHPKLGLSILKIRPFHRSERSLCPLGSLWTRLSATLRWSIIDWYGLTFVNWGQLTLLLDRAHRCHAYRSTAFAK